MIEQLERVEEKKVFRSPPPPPVRPRVVPGLTTVEEEDGSDDESFFQRHRVGLIIGGIALLGIGGMYFHKSSGPSAPARKAREMPIVRIQLPPPPPPPPKIQPPPPKDEKQTEQAPMAKPEQKPEEAKPKPVDKPPEGLGTNIKGPGQGIAGLGSSGNGMIGGTGDGPGGGGSPGAWYAGQVQSRIAEALRTNRKTRSASINGVKFSLSLNASGRVSGVELQGSTGDPALDNAIRNEILAGLQMPEPPPGGKAMKVTMKLTARRPN